MLTKKPARTSARRPSSFLARSLEAQLDAFVIGFELEHALPVLDRERQRTLAVAEQRPLMQQASEANANPRVVFMPLRQLDQLADRCFQFASA